MHTLSASACLSSAAADSARPFVPLPAPVLTGDVYEQLPTIMTVKLALFACGCFINFVCTLALEHEKAFIPKRLQRMNRRNLTAAF